MVLRLTCLASAAVVALSAGATAAAQAPAQTPPATTSNSEDIYLRADVVTEDQANLIMTAEGNVEVRVGQRTLKADKLVYDESKQTMRAQGRVEITDIDGSIQFADDIEIDEDFRNGFATRFAARLAGNALVTASSAIRTDGTRNSLEQVVYTGCPVCEAEGNEPTWSIRARRAEQNTETQMISYQDAVFEIKGIPVLYIPWFAHPDPSSERRSGLMVPDLGVSSKYGPFYEQPYYWAISPSQEMTIAPMISGEVSPLIKVDYRKLFFSGYVDFETSFTHEQEFNSDGDKEGADKFRGHIYGSGRFNIDKNWQWGFGIERQTDDLYDQRYDIDGEDDLRGLVASQPRQLMSQLYATGQHEDFYFEAAVYDFQGLREFDNDAEFPEVIPSLYVQKLFDLGSNGTISTDFSAAALFRDAAEALPNDDPLGTRRLALDTARVTANAEWKAQYIFGPGLVLSPYLEGRADFYRFDSFLEDGTPSDREELGRALGVAGAQLSYPFIRRGENVDIVVEPIAMIAYGSDGANDRGIPNEDSQLFEGDDSNLLDPNPIPTYDLWEGGGRTALGINTAVKFADDSEISAQVARRWRQEEDPAFNDLSNLADETSDYVASVKADLGRVLNAGIRLRMDDDFSINRIDVSASANIWRASGSARYFKISNNAAGDEDEGLVWNGTLKISDRWSAIVEQTQNIALNENIRLSMGIGYRDDCSFFGLFYQRDGGRDRILGPSESIRFQFVLTGLGGLSDADID